MLKDLGHHIDTQSIKSGLVIHVLHSTSDDLFCRFLVDMRMVEYNVIPFILGQVPNFTPE